MRRTFSGLTLADQVANAMSKLDMVGEEQPNALEEASKTIAEECNAAWRDSEEQPRPHELRLVVLVRDRAAAVVFVDVPRRRAHALEAVQHDVVELMPHD